MKALLGVSGRGITGHGRRMSETGVRWLSSLLQRDSDHIRCHEHEMFGGNPDS